MNKLWRNGVGWGVVLALGACSTPRDITVTTPQQWDTQDALFTKSQAQDGEGASEWWRELNDPVLEVLLSRAVEANRTLEGVRARVRRARAVRNSSRAELFPQLNLQGDYLKVGTEEGGVTSEGYRGGVDAAWELDLFGVNRGAARASAAELQGSMEDYVDALRVLRAEVALRYLDLRASEAQRAVTEANLRAQDETLALTKSRYQGGFASLLEVSQAEGIRLATAALLPSFEAERAGALFSLSELLARPAAEVEEVLAQHPLTGNIPTPPERFAVTVPDVVLNRRPDVRAREAAVRAAIARREGAEAERFPRLSVSALFSYEDESLTPEARIWRLGSGLLSPLLSFGRVQGKIDLRSAEEDEAVSQYQAVVLAAVREVESALSGYRYQLQRVRALRGVVEANRKTLELARTLYVQGLGEFLNVLDAERALYSAESQEVISKVALSRAAVTLYKVLGGGWSEAESVLVKRALEEQPSR